MANKVQYNLKNTHYAKMIVGEDGTISWDTPVPIPGSVSIALDAQGEISKFYADGITYYKASVNNGYEGDLVIALVPESFRIDILGETLDTQNVLIENSEVPVIPFALLFEFDGDKKAIRHVLFNCVSARTSLESQTKEDTIDPATETLTISATPLANGNVKAKTGNDTETADYDNWYDTVYQTPVVPEV